MDNTGELALSGIMGRSVAIHDRETGTNIACGTIRPGELDVEFCHHG